MEPVYHLSDSKKKELLQRGYKEFEQPFPNRACDPADVMYHACSLGVIAISLYGRKIARANHLHHSFFSFNVLMVPFFYMMSFNYLYVSKDLNHMKRRPNFNELLEHYPVTRRAWKRALLAREHEMEHIKSKLA